MPANRIVKVLAIILLTLLSSLFDSQGFVHSARIWADGRWIWREVARATLSFGLGFLLYWLSIRYLNEFGIVSPEIQTLGWFVVTIAGVAVFSGDFMRWPMSDRVIALGVLGGQCWLLFRVGGLAHSWMPCALMTNRRVFRDVASSPVEKQVVARGEERWHMPRLNPVQLPS